MAERTLVCIINQTRAHEITWPGFKRFVLDETGADLAVCVGVGPDYDHTNPFYANAQHRWTIEEPEDYGNVYDMAARILGSTADWRRLMEVPSQWLGGVKGPHAHPASAGIGIFYRWFLLHNLRESGALDAYDRFIVTRSDYYYVCPHPPLPLLDSRYFWVPDGEDYQGIVDRYGLFNRADVEAGLNFLEHIVREPDELYRRMSWYRNWNPERCLRMHLERFGVAHRLRRFPFFMFAARGDSDTSTWTMGDYDPALNCYVKYPAEHERAMRAQGRFRSAQDWTAFLTGTVRPD